MRAGCRSATGAMRCSKCSGSRVSNNAVAVWAILAHMAVELPTNFLYFGDNLGWLREHGKFLDASIDLVYLDPPFNSNRSYNVLFRATSATAKPRSMPSKTLGRGPTTLKRSTKSSGGTTRAKRLTC